MDPATLLMIPGVLGGVLLAVLLRLTNRARPVGVDPFRREPLSTDVINIAHIKVAGVGGLGLVAMAIIVAVNVPPIGRSLAIGLAAGAALAVALILVNRPRD
jgi:hypothetical protein